MDRLQANKSANLDDFTSLLHKLINAAWGAKWGLFTQAFPNGRDPASVDLPVITYHCRRKRPGNVGKTTQEIKPRFRGTYQDTADPDKSINVYSQTLDHEVIFDVWAETNAQADELANRFEDFMMTYAGYFMKNGVQQLIFLEQSDETSSMAWKDGAVVRSYKYLVRLEKHVEVPLSTIKEVIGKVSAITERDLLNDSIDEESINFKN